MKKTVCALLLGAFVSVLAGCASAQENKTGGPDTARMERFLRRYYAWPDVIKVDIGQFKPSPVNGLLETTVRISHQGQHQDLNFLVSQDGRHIVQGEPLDVTADPFAATRAKIETKGFPALGSPLAPVTIVEYSDLQCSFCRGAATTLTQNVMQAFPDQVRLVFKDFPLVDIHPWAMPASALGRCIVKRYSDAGFWTYHNWVFENQPKLSAGFKEMALTFLKEKGMDTAALGECMEKPDVRAEVDKSMAEGRSLGVTGTPTMFINGRRVVGNQPFGQLRQIIETELQYARAAK